MAPEDPVQGIAETVGNRRVCLQFHSDPEAVQVNARNRRLLGDISGLPVDDGRQDGDLVRRKSLFEGLLAAFGRPEAVMFFLEQGQDLRDGRGPQDLIRIRNDHAEKTGRIGPEPGEGIGREHIGGDFGRIHQHLRPDLPGQDLTGPDAAREGQVHGGLPA